MRADPQSLRGVTVELEDSREVSLALNTVKKVNVEAGHDEEDGPVVFLDHMVITEERLGTCHNYPIPLFGKEAMSLLVGVVIMPEATDPALQAVGREAVAQLIDLAKTQAEERYQEHLVAA